LRSEYLKPDNTNQHLQDTFPQKRQYKIHKSAVELTALKVQSTVCYDKALQYVHVMFGYPRLTLECDTFEIEADRCHPSIRIDQALNYTLGAQSPE